MSMLAWRTMCQRQYALTDVVREACKYNNIHPKRFQAAPHEVLMKTQCNPYKIDTGATSEAQTEKGHTWYTARGMAS